MRPLLLALTLLLAATGVLAPAAHAAGGLTKAEADAARAWSGRACTPTGCGPAPASTAGSVLGFGAAALGGIWAARRRDRASR